MNRGIGYVFAIGGLVLMVLGFDALGLNITMMEGIMGTYVAGAGIVGVVIGVILTMADGTGRRRQDKTKGRTEVPIYEGVGKKRMIVGYRKD